MTTNSWLPRLICSSFILWPCGNISIFRNGIQCILHSTTLGHSLSVFSSNFWRLRWLISFFFSLRWTIVSTYLFQNSVILFLHITRAGQQGILSFVEYAMPPAEQSFICVGFRVMQRTAWYVIPVRIGQWGKIFCRAYEVHSTPKDDQSEGISSYKHLLIFVLYDYNWLSVSQVHMSSVCVSILCLV